MTATPSLPETGTGTRDLPKNAPRPRRPGTDIHQPPNFDLPEKGTCLGDIVESGSGHPASDPDSHPRRETARPSRGDGR